MAEGTFCPETAAELARIRRVKNRARILEILRLDASSQSAGTHLIAHMTRQAMTEMDREAIEVQPVYIFTPVSNALTKKKDAGPQGQMFPQPGVFTLIAFCPTMEGLSESC